MDHKYFGQLIKDVRKARNLTQTQLAEGICSRREVTRIENGEYEPSTYLISLLSQKLNFDLLKCYSNFKFSKTIVAYEIKLKLHNIIKHNNDEELKGIISEMEKLPEFLKDENLQYLYYARALYEAKLNNNYSYSTELCIAGVKVKDPSFSLEKFVVRSYSEISLSLLHCIGCNYIRQNNLKMGCCIFEKLLSTFDQIFLTSGSPHYQYNSFDKQLYQNTAYNLSTIYYKSNKLDLALSYIDKGISFSCSEDTIQLLPLLLQQKFCILCKLGNYSDAKNAYQQCCTLYELLHNRESLLKLEADYSELYPQF